MSQQQVERGVQSLYEEIGVRDELTDDEAQTLLAWAEEQVTRIAAQDLDDEGFETALAQLKRLMRGMNRFSARLAELSPEEQQSMLAKMQVAASAVGLNPSAAFSAQAAADPYDVKANLQALMATFSAPSAPPTSPVAPAAPPDPPDVPDPDAPDLTNLLSGTTNLLSGLAALSNVLGLPDLPGTPDVPDVPDAPDMPDMPSNWDSM